MVSAKKKIVLTKDNLTKRRGASNIVFVIHKRSSNIFFL